ncbi:MAG: GGDEF domain-containing protein [Nitrospirae bacterium]|nr:GGDEF domain-containing protein [Nitrospirota bacterium]
MFYKIKSMVVKTKIAVEMVYETAKGIDYKQLSHYILKINQVHDIDRILFEAAKCVKAILNYELFGFALLSSDCLNIWIDPRVHSAHLEKIIRDDFNYLSPDIQINYLDCKEIDKFQGTGIFNSARLISYQVLDEDFKARLYIMPVRKMLNYHEKIMQLIAKTLNIAINNTLNLNRLKDEATIDPLTGVYNRRALFKYIEHDLANAVRHESTMSIIMFDIDHFKKVNDTYGHHAGDVVLKKLSDVVKHSFRKSDYIARYGGEEFVIVLPDTKISSAIEMAEKLRVRIEELQIDTCNEIISVTSSFGIASSKEDSDVSKMMKEADKMLYFAKENGRNQVAPNLRLHVNNAVMAV